MINGTTLRRLREGKGLSQDRLAEISHVAKRTISRIEGGNGSKSNQTTAQRLAKALKVEPELLANEIEDDAEIERELQNAGYRRIQGYVDADTSLGFDMVQHRYGVTSQELIGAAPLLLALLAESSLVWRRRKVDALYDAAETMSAIAHSAKHLAFGHAGISQETAMQDEIESITRRDVFGGKINDEVYDFGVSTEDTNPFLNYLKSLVEELPKGTVHIRPDDDFMLDPNDKFPSYRVAPDDLEAIYAGDYWAEFALKNGHASLSAIPDELRDDNRTDDRVKWIKDQIPIEALEKHQKWLDSLKHLNLKL